MRNVRLALKVLGGTVFALVALVGTLYVTNTTPQLRALSVVETESSAKPIVIKLHAQWCYICRGTKGAWEEVVEAYRDRAHLLVFDFTNSETTAASEAEARRLKLDRVFEEYWGASGLVLVVDSATREAVSEVGGFVKADAYRSAIDAFLARR
jgi:thiol-disulfide isomerase/thioredoxin